MSCKNCKDNELFTYEEVKRAFKQLNVAPGKTCTVQLDLFELKTWGLKVGDSIFEAMKERGRIPEKAMLVAITASDMRNTINILYSKRIPSRTRIHFPKGPK